MTISNVSNDHTALAIPNQLQKNITSPAPSIKPVNHPPITNVGPEQTVNESSRVMLVGAAVDPDLNDKISYSWKQVGGPAVTLNNADTASPTFTAPSNIASDNTQLKFALTAKDDKGAASNNPAIVTVTVKHVNHPPIANAGTDQIVNPGYIVTLDGSKSKDPDSGDQLTYSWVQIAGPTVKLDGANSPIATFTASSNISSNTSLIFKLTVKDSKNAANTSTVKVTDKYTPPPNQPPTADAGIDQTVNAGDKVDLDGTKSKDPNGAIKSYSWKQVGGPAVTLDNANTATPSFTASSDISTSNVLIFRLTVTDDKNATGISTVKVTVNPVNHPPVANAGQDQTVNAGYVTTLDGSKSSDPDNDPLTYLWKQTSGTNITLNGADQPIATFTAPKDITSDTDMKFELTVTDSKNASSIANVKVTDNYVPPPNQPPKANAGTDQTVNAGDNVTLNGNGSSDPDGTVVSYSWMQTSGPAVTLSGADTSTPTLTAPNVSSDTELKFSLTVKDDKGAASNDPATVTVTVKAAPAVPSSPSPSIATAPSNQTKGSVSNDYVFVRKWGSFGSGDGQFNSPEGIAIDSSGNVYVSENSNKRVQKFDSNGNFITKWGFEGDSLRPAVDSSDNVYVTDCGNNRVQKFDNNGNFITEWGSRGTGDGQFYCPDDIAIDSSNSVYVSDFTHRVQKFDNNGNFITKLEFTMNSSSHVGQSEKIAVDSSDNLYVYVDYTSDKITTEKFDSNGNFITRWSNDGYITIGGLDIDLQGNIFVSDYGNNRVQKFDNNGNFITEWGSKGTGDGQFNGPHGIALDSSGNVYVADYGNFRIQVFAPSSTTNSNNTSK